MARSFSFVFLVSRRATPILVGVGFFGALASTASAATVTVNTTTPNSSTDSKCGLVEAVQAINQHSTYRSCTYVSTGLPDRIEFSVSGTHVIDAEMTLVRSVDFVGTGVSSTVIQSGGIYAFGVMLNGSDGPRLTVSFSNLTIQKKASQSLPVMGVYVASGPVVQNLVMDTVRVTGFNAPGIFLSGSQGDITMNLQNSTIEGNAQGIKISDSSAFISNNIIRNNTGGGIEVDLPNELNAVDLTGCTIEGNTAGGSGAGISYSYTGTLPNGAHFLDISDSTIRNNHAAGNGGGLFADGDFSVTRTIFDNNTADQNGGGIGVLINANQGQARAVVQESIFSNNHAVNGAGIDIDGDGTTAVARLVMAQSQVGPGNVATGNGGGIRSLGQVEAISNSTISTNTAAKGGGIFQAGGGEFHIHTSTLAFNKATAVGGGGGLNLAPSNIKIEACILAKNTAPAPTPSTAARYADFIAAGPGTPAWASIIEDVKGAEAYFPTANGNKVADPKLFPDLMNWGGFTSVHGLQWGSPAIDIAAAPGTDAFFQIDQRGVARPADGADGASPARTGIDAGAFEQVPRALDNVFGFETQSSWTSTAALTLSTTPRTQGRVALSVAGSGARTIKSAAVTTPLLPLSGHLALDFFLPANQPDTSAQGSVAMSLSCPSTGFTSSFGSVSLNGKPAGSYSKLVFNVGSTARAILAQPRSDCFFNIVVTTSAAPTKPLLDNLRFVP